MSATPETQSKKWRKFASADQMERRRLAVLCSHLWPSRRSPMESASSTLLSTSSCYNGGDSGSLERPEEGSGKDSCVFCLIVCGESPAFKLYEDDICICILDSNPLCLGHSLVIPKMHFPSLQATPASVVAAMCSTVPFLTNAIMKATQCDSFNLLVNNGASAGQVIFHTHFHIIPRRAGDRLWRSEGHRQPITGDKETLTLVSRIQDQIVPRSLAPQEPS